MNLNYSQELPKIHENSDIPFEAQDTSSHFLNRPVLGESASDSHVTSESESESHFADSCTSATSTASRRRHRRTDEDDEEVAVDEDMAWLQELE